MSSWNSYYQSSCNFAAYDEVDKGEASTNKAYVRNPSPAPVKQQLCDVDMLSRELVASQESIVKALRELNNSLGNERDHIIDENSDYYDKKLKHNDQKDKLVAEIVELKKDIRLLKDEIVQLRTLKVHYRKEGESNRNKLREMKIILQRDM